MRGTGIETIRYIIAALALGLIAVWGSENFFWSAPPPDLTIEAWLGTWAAYAAAAAVALSAVGLTRVAGLRAGFLGGALLGFVVEGVVVDEMYAAFPFQLVWTPLAWHALITGVCVFGLGRAAAHWRLWRHLLALAGLGLFGAVFASFWPAERAAMPPGDVVFLYLAGAGFVVPLGQIVLDRIGPVPRPPLAVGLIAPGLALALWLAKSLATPSLPRLAFPVMVGLTLWAMWRSGAAERSERADFGPRGRIWRHLLFPIAPAITTFVAVPVWESTGALPGNVAVAAVTVPLSLGWWLWLIWRGARRGARREARRETRRGRGPRTS